MTMTPITIGLPSGDGRNVAHNAMQEWLYSLGVNVYYPQTRFTNSYNLAQQWDAEKEQLNWLPVAVDEAKRFDKPMVGYYPQYFWRDRIVGKKSPNPNAFAFAGISQDKLQPAEMAYYLRAVRNWLQARGIAQPWYMIDEPAHPVDGDPYKYGWSATMEARVVKFVTALVDAGWTVGVCHPNYQAHTYWRDRLPAQRVILNAESRRADYGGITGEVWLYNKRGTFDGLADRMREFGAVGYLHWSATWDKLPLATMNGMAWEPTAHMDELLRQIESFEIQPPLPPEVKSILDEIQAARLDIVMAMAVLDKAKARINAAEQLAEGAL